MLSSAARAQSFELIAGLPRARVLSTENPRPSLYHNLHDLQGFVALAETMQHQREIVLRH